MGVFNSVRKADMQNGWFKLHKKFVENDVWLYDPTAWRVFEYLLATVDYKTGSRKIGRRSLAEAIHVNQNTIKDAISRLGKRKMVTSQSTNRFTIITICNWYKYQHDDTNQITNETPTRHQRDTTLKELRTKNKENIHASLRSALEDFKKHRKGLRKPLTDRALELIIQKVQRWYPEDIPRQISCLEQSIEMGWQGVFELPQESQGNENEITAKDIERMKKYV